MKTGTRHDAALVVFSGGQDSTTCLFWAKEHFAEVRALTFLYGQKHREEVNVAQRIARTADVAWDVLDASFIASIGTSALTDTRILMDSEKPAEGPPNTFVPGRNLFS
jgi:7-cyano-7-deazaguanine synthase